MSTRPPPRPGGPPTANVLGIEVEGCTPEVLIERLLSPEPEERQTILYANPHVLNTAYGDEETYRALSRADLVYVDGVGVQLAAGLLGARVGPRATAADWVDRLCGAAASRGVRIFLLAGRDGIAARAADLLSGRHRGLQVVGTHHGYLDRASTPRVISEINAANPDLLVVGMGTPAQERWIVAHRATLHVPVVWGVGALLDVVVGVQPRAPAWLADNHLEWLWRLGTDPVRLGSRYLMGNPIFLARVLRQRWFGLPERLRGRAEAHER